MSPRVSPPPSHGLDHGLDRLTALVDQCTIEYAVIDQCMKWTRLATVEPSDRRLTAVRAYLDRATEARLRIATHLRFSKEHLGNLERAYQHASDEVVNQASGNFVGRGLAAEERSAMYRLRLGRQALDVVAQVRTLSELVVGFDRAARDAISFIEGHRIEALTLLRAGARISADEYNSFASNLPDANGEVPGLS